MRKKCCKVLILFIAVFFLCNSLAFAAVDSKEEKGTAGYSEQGLLGDMKHIFLDGWDIKSRLNILFGYDNNVYLNPERRGSEFWETLWKIDFAKDINDNLEGSVGYKFLDMIYTGAQTTTFYKSTARTGLRIKNLNEQLLGKAYLFTNFYFDWVDYPNKNTYDQLQYRYDLGVNQKISKLWYHQLLYEFMYKGYLKGFIRDTNGNLEDDKKRKDVRNTLTYEVGKYFQKALTKMFYEFYRNTSNEGYLNYYDYDSYKIGGSLTYLFNKKLTGYVSLAHQWRLYEGRTVANDSTNSITADDKTYIANTSLFYQLNKKTSLAVSYTYRENVSKECSQMYSSSVITGGVYYKF